jgi:hypothetical protein
MQFIFAVVVVWEVLMLLPAISYFGNGNIGSAVMTMLFIKMFFLVLAAVGCWLLGKQIKKLRLKTVKISNAKSVDKELNSETYPEKTNNTARAWLLVIGVVILVIWLVPDQENKNTLPVSVAPTQSTQAQTQPAQAQQAIPLSANSAQDMFQSANDLYNQGKYAEALLLYQNLAGYSGAQISLGRMYENGNGVTMDYNQAVYWYRKAAEIGDENEKDARTALNKLIGKEKKTTPHNAQLLPSQAKQTRPSNTNEYVPPKIPGDINNDGILSGSEQYLRDHH